MESTFELNKSQKEALSALETVSQHYEINLGKHYTIKWKTYDTSDTDEPASFYCKVLCGNCLFSLTLPLEITKKDNKMVYGNNNVRNLLIDHTINCHD